MPHVEDRVGRAFQRVGAGRGREGARRAQAGQQGRHHGRGAAFHVAELAQRGVAVDGIARMDAHAPEALEEIVVAHVEAAGAAGCEVRLAHGGSL